MTAETMVLERSVSPATMTAGVLRDLLATLPPDLELHVGVWDANRFNVLIGTLPVSAAWVTPGRRGEHLLLRVPGIS